MYSINQQLSLATVLAVNLLGSVAHAQWGIGAEALNPLSQYKGVSNKIAILPDILYREDNKQLEKNRFSYGLAISSKNAGFKSKDDKVFKGMKTRKDSLDLGVQVIIDTPFVPLTVEITNDLDASKSYQASVKIGGVSSVNSSDRSLQVRPYIGVHYHSSKVIDYHYGVRMSEQTANRKAYQGKSATTPFLGVEAITNLTPNITLNANIDYEERANSVRNSPLTNNKKYDLRGALGITYWF